MSDDIYSREQTLKNSLETIRGSDILDENKLQILKFYTQCSAEGLSTARIAKYLYTLHQISNLLNKPFAKANRDDIIRVVEKLERDRAFSDWTRQHYRVTLKKFYRWLRKVEVKGVYPEEVSWISTNVKNGSSRLPTEILTEDEIGRISNVATNTRDKALVQVFYESGARVGELLTLKIKQIVFDENGALLMVRGKTGDRRVRIIASAPTLSTWLSNHPDRDNPEARLWLSFATNCKNEPLNYRGLYELFKELARRAGVKKRTNPHSFRHARATHLANKLTEQQLKILFGWTAASKMASVYVHLSGRDVDNALLELHGLANQAKSEPKFKLKICPRCNEHNSPDSKYCKRCALVIDAETLEWENEQMNRLVKQPRVASYLRRVMAQGRK